MISKKASLTVGKSKKNIGLPVYKGTERPEAIDITTLYKESGLFTYDPGYMSTASCESSITYVDGEKYILRYRGYDIAELARKSNFIEVCYLLLNGELPNKKDFELFVSEIKNRVLVHEHCNFYIGGFPRFSHPMAIMCGAFASLLAFYQDPKQKI
jgi:citrate synthase